MIHLLGFLGQLILYVEEGFKDFKEKRFLIYCFLFISLFVAILSRHIPQPYIPWLIGAYVFVIIAFIFFYITMILKVWAPHKAERKKGLLTVLIFFLRILLFPLLVMAISVCLAFFNVFPFPFLYFFTVGYIILWVNGSFGECKTTQFWLNFLLGLSVYILMMHFRLNEIIIYLWLLLFMVYLLPTKKGKSS